MIMVEAWQVLETLVHCDFKVLLAMLAMIPPSGEGSQEILFYLHAKCLVLYVIRGEMGSQDTKENSEAKRNRQTKSSFFLSNMCCKSQSVKEVTFLDIRLRRSRKGIRQHRTQKHAETCPCSVASTWAFSLNSPSDLVQPRPR